MNLPPKKSDNSSSNSKCNSSSQSGKTDCVRKNGNLQQKEDDAPKIPLSSYTSLSNGACNKDDDEVLKKLFSDYKVFENWCSITYYEFNIQVGETFHVTNNSLGLNVNNFTDPSNSTRFCLGSLTNEHRKKISERKRKKIGAGIVLYLQTNGDVWLRQNCGEDIFVESNFLIKESKLTNNNTAQQICTHAYNKIYSLKLAYDRMKRRINADPNSKADINIFKQFFTLYISFGQEWGPKCPQKTIDETPCWIEIQLHPPSKLLDILKNQ